MITQVMRTFNVALTAEEVRTMGVEMGKAQQAKDGLERRKKQVTKELGAQIEAQQDLISTLAAQLAAGTGFKEIPCEMRYDEPKGGWTPEPWPGAGAENGEC